MFTNKLDSGFGFSLRTVCCKEWQGLGSRAAGQRPDWREGVRQVKGSTWPGVEESGGMPAEITALNKVPLCS